MILLVLIPLLREPILSFLDALNSREVAYKGLNPFTEGTYSELKIFGVMVQTLLSLNPFTEGTYSEAINTFSKDEDE